MRKPTQNALGFDEVNDTVARYKATSVEELKDDLLVRQVPIVLPDGTITSTE